jgi:hypothetical protein
MAEEASGITTDMNGNIVRGVAIPTSSTRRKAAGSTTWSASSS